MGAIYPCHARLVGMEGPVMKVTRIIVAGLAIATLGLSANASAQEWGPVSYTHLTLPTNREV